MYASTLCSSVWYVFTILRLMTSFAPWIDFYPLEFDPSRMTRAFLT